MEIKVVGKIVLEPTNGTIIKKFNHFFERLYGRYGILLTMDEYIFLSSLWLRKGKKSKDGKSIIGILTIKDVEVKVVKSIFPPNYLLTSTSDKEKRRKEKTGCV